MNSFFFFILSPLDQFEIINLLSVNTPLFGNITASITNISLYLTLSGVILTLISLMSTKKQ